ncbi:MAG: hypothetical protein A2W91_12315 [Bacteroidetes bacterium GWF2_38_335]|nr:MAG: hypothetical protein A2W91_12315 [Bacteroidetes bacterium GWF2_38_335]OFY76953.1 MAG: hypothetical protein A2281_00430 [Bacteroidetes bacterium RIFOXYA12_FULL_38_20]HBS86807.1 hypothetical protein [Bacteroidales bacterium]
MSAEKLKISILLFFFSLIFNLTWSQTVPFQGDILLQLSADSIHYSSGANVDTIYDISGNNHHVFQTNSASQPTVTSSSLLNNQNTFLFDGIDDFLSGNLISDFENKSLSIFAIASGGNQGGIAACIFGINSYPNCFWVARRNFTEEFMFLNNGELIESTGNTLPNSGFNYILFNVIKSFNIEATIYINYSQLNSSSSTGIIGSFINSDFYIGKTPGYETWTGEIAEILIYEKALTDPEKLDVENYFRAKYSPPIELGADICNNDESVVISAGERFIDYLWSTGETTNQIVVSSSNDYSVTVTDVFGNISSDTIRVSLFHPNIISDTTICLNDTIIWNTNLANTDYNFLWQDNSTDSIISIYDNGEYFVKICLTDNPACVFYSDTIVVTIDSIAEIVTLDPNMDLCSGNTISVINYVDYSYFWQDGSHNSFFIVETTGDYWVVVTNSNGCTGTDSTHVNIIGEAPVADFDFSITCFGQLTQFTNTSFTTDGSSITSYQWNFGEANSSTLSDPTNIYTDTGEYYVSLEISTDVGCSQDTVISISVLPKPNAAFSFFPMGCVNIEQSFEDHSSLNGTSSIINWEWNFGDSETSNEQNPMHSFSDTGEYNVSLIIQSENLCYDSVSYSLNIIGTYPDPQTFELLSPPPFYITLENNVLFSWNNSLNASSYKLELSEDQLFTEIIFSAITENLTYNAPLFLYDSLFWRVTAYNYCNDSIVSEQQSIIHLLPDTENGLVMWLISDRETAGSASIWEDISINNFNPFQTDENKVPQLIENGIDTFSVLRFDGVNDHYIFSEDLIFDSLSFFIVFKKNVTGNSGMLAGDQSSNNCIANYSDGGTYIVGDGGYTSILNGEILNFTILSIVTDGLFANFNINKVPVDASLAFTYNVILNAIGQRNGGEFLNGDIAEILLFNIDVSIEKRKEIEDYLHFKYAPPVNLGNDIYIPYGFEEHVIDANSRYVNYLWSNDSASQTIAINKSGEYSVTVTDIFGYTSTDEIRVFYPDPYVPEFVNLCLGDTFIWNTNLIGNYNFIWSDESTDSVLLISDEGSVFVTIFDSIGNFITTDSFSIIIDSFPIHATLGPDRDLCVGNLITIEGDEATDFLWPDGSTDEYYMVDTSGVYWVTAINENGCVKSDSVLVNITGIAPTTGFTQNTTCFGQETNFSDTSYTTDGSNIISYNWDFGDSGSSVLQNPEHTFADTGLYTVVLEITTDSGCSNFQEKDIYVHPLPQVGFGPSQACKGDAVHFENNSFVPVDDITSYLWEFGDGTNSTGENPMHAYTIAGDIAVNLIVTSDYGCADSLSQIITIKPAPIAGFSHSIACAGSFIDFFDETVHSGLNPVLSSLWVIDGETGVEASSTSWFASEPGAITVSYMVQTINGCRDTATGIIVVHDVPTASFETFIACEGDLTQIVESSTSTDGEITKWNWNVEGIGAYSDSDPLFETPDTGTFEIILVISDENHCLDTAFGVLNVFEKPYSDFGFNPWFGTPGSEIEFTNNSLRFDDNLWDFGDGQTSTEIDPVISYADSGVFDITLITSNDEGCFDTLIRKISVIMPIYDIAVLSVDHEIVDNKLYVSAFIANLGTIPVYNLDLKIDFNKGSSFTETRTGEFMMGSVIYYTFHAIYEFSDYTLPDYICVEAELDAGITDINPQNNIKCNNEGASFALLEPYPNPAGDQITIEFIIPYSDVIILDIYDSNGKQVDRGIIESPLAGLNRFTYNTSKLAKGTYHVKMNYEGSLKSVRFVKN